MKNLNTVMKRDEAIKDFEVTYVPVILAREKVNGKRDMPLRRQLWNDFYDSLNKNGLISDWQADNWTQPDFCVL